jgi:hypothetical protein
MDINGYAWISMDTRRGHLTGFAEQTEPSKTRRYRTGLA